MTIRKDGEETRERILDTACVVFGDRGYRNATHAEICKHAGVNIAAINYHFGSKAELYRAAWEHITEKLDRLYPTDGGITPEQPPEERLRTRIRNLLARRADQALFGQFHRIRMREFLNPTGLLDAQMAEWLQRNRQMTRDIVADLLGPHASSAQLESCEMSVISQCIMARPLNTQGALPPQWTYTEEDLQRLEDHITTFSLAGIRALRNRIESQESDEVQHAALS